MTKKNRPTPWRELVHLKEELRSGELALAEFAADLHDVVTGSGKRRLYEDPEKFFALTYPTHPLRELAKDVGLRLAGGSDKAVRQLELTYGGGKTHTLITLYHLFGPSGELPDLPAVREFRQHLGESPRSAASPRRTGMRSRSPRRREFPWIDFRRGAGSHTDTSAAPSRFHAVP